MTSSGGSHTDLNPSGSPHSGEPVFLAVGRLGRPFGLQGEIAMSVLTDFPERLVPDITLYIGPDHEPLVVRKSRWHGDKLLIAFAGYNTREAVGSLRNLWVTVRADDRPPLPEGEFYHHQIIGLRVMDEAGSLLGILTEILETGANDVYIVSPDKGEDILLPAIESVILAIDLEAGWILVRPLPGLI